jgi:LPS-assembly lipoprotein
MKNTREYIILFALLTFTSCGFRPLYGAQGPSTTTSNVQQTLNHIAIASIPDRSGVVLRNALIDRFHTHGTPNTPTYTLNIAPIAETREGLDITIDEEVTRTQLRLSTTLTLTRARDQTPVLTRTLYALASYNVLESQFTTRVSANNARDNAINDLARQVEQAIVLYLQNAAP